MKYVWTALAIFATYGAIRALIESNLDFWWTVLISAIVVLFQIRFVVDEWERAA